MRNPITREDYERVFGIDPSDNRRKLAHEQALDIRKFEIQLYWTRAAYFWTFIAAALAAYGAIQALANGRPKTDLSVVVACLGFVFSFAWYCVNRASKHWQENWENHVDMLENTVTGPLYKVVLQREPPGGIAERADLLVVGPAAFSVSKINQIISLYVCAIWILLLWYALPDRGRFKSLSATDTVAIVLSVFAAILIVWRGRTFTGDYNHVASVRNSAIVPAGRADANGSPRH